MRIHVEFDVENIGELRDVLAAGRDYTLRDAKVVDFKIGTQAKPASANSVIDGILALYKQWESTTPKVQHVWGAQAFIQWVKEQQQ